jgi:hypothetical protein
MREDASFRSPWLRTFLGFAPSTGAARSNAMANHSTMTRETLRAIIDSVEYDPLAGQGVYSKKDLLIDRLLAHCRTATHVAAPAAPPALILTEVAPIEGMADHEPRANRAA